MSTAADHRLPLVLLHAYPLDSRMWDDVRAALSAEVRLITPDQRGLGTAPLAEEDAETPAPDLAVVAADVVALLDRLGIERAIVGGASMGGYAAMALLRLAPERVAGLLLVDTKSEADQEAPRAARLDAAARAETEGTADWIAAAMLPKLAAASTHQTRPAVVDRLRRLIEEQPAAGVAWAQRAMAVRPDSTAVLRDSGLPTLIVVGEQDELSPPDGARRLVELLPHGRLEIVPDAGHLVPMEAPTAFLAAVLPWLAERRGR
ncbi:MULTISPECIES: alpha/beta fold hydrolase [Actinoalloteichus]|uniref:Hydrolase or acyltransferase of alpha/beta superfamily n=1 Tax=Actinoalloteichus fjordicus TaxID=1612552 RepID=A0AAC9PQT1_9PSEU|nr:MULTISPECIES: alpha/beta fold hydrolase [Actinoalloteichus]APU13504.1 putative hydrolase or acyltransferase of alpha/beta superfamily [Actinoalloteichus fjordicus]APU19453.1 putative hydrolase or acyltransferase of alpha/beta superfamily [Actinoalloteichus sp. GBA129-24]